MNYQIGFIITAILLVAFIIFYIYKRRDYNKMLFGYKPLKLKYDNLKDEFDRLQAHASTPPKEREKHHASKKDKTDSAEVRALNDKIRALKDDNAKLKEKNFNLSRDNDQLRLASKDKKIVDDHEQREIVALRDEKSELEGALEKAKQQLKTFEDAKRAAEYGREDNANRSDETLDALKRENASLVNALKEVRAELSTLRHEEKAQIADAIKATSEQSGVAERALKKDLASAQKLVSQAKKRADNNHKIYLIARSELQLVEEKLMTYDATYRPFQDLPVKNHAIDEFVKKFLTFEARENKASRDVLQKDRVIRDLEAKNQELEAKIATHGTNGDFANADNALDNVLSGFENALDFGDKSLGDFMASLSRVDAEKEKKSSEAQAQNIFAKLDMTKLDDDWDSL